MNDAVIHDSRGGAGNTESLDEITGAIIDFGGATLKEGLQLAVNHLTPSASPRLRVNQLP